MENKVVTEIKKLFAETEFKKTDADKSDLAIMKDWRTGEIILCQLNHYEFEGCTQTPIRKL